MAHRRTPAQLLVLSVTIGCGILIGAVAVGWHLSGDASGHGRNLLPDILLEGVSPAELERHGFHISGKEPHSWSAISVRVFQDERGTVTFVRCHVAPEEVDALFRFPVGSRRPLQDVPPEDWPWGRTAGDPFAVPAWWHPTGLRSRIYEHLTGEQSAGLFANYDAATMTLHFWQWMRSDVHPARPAPVALAMADEFATAMEIACRTRPATLGSDGWIRAVGMPPSACGLPPERLPSGLTSIDAALYPVNHRHRYLLVLHGLTADQAWAVAGEVPLRRLDPDAPPPLGRWGFAAIPGIPASLPVWFSPGPGQRRAHCLLNLGAATVEAGRWAAYDEHDRALYLWDWAGPESQAPVADLCP